jgi:hypothetical protein
MQDRSHKPGWTNQIIERKCHCHFPRLGSSKCPCLFTVKIKRLLTSVISLDCSPTIENGCLDLTATICTACQSTGTLMATYTSETSPLFNFSFNAVSSLVSFGENRVEIDAESSNESLFFRFRKAANNTYNLYVNDRNLVTWDISSLPDLEVIRTCNDL